jgi:hypothetical protein
MNDKALALSNITEEHTPLIYLEYGGSMLL